MTNTKLIGDFYENLAEKYLLENGYTIIGKKCRSFHIEVDIIAEKDNIIHIIEVKFRTHINFLQFKKVQIKNIFNYIELHFPNNFVQFDIIFFNRVNEMQVFSNCLLEDF